MCSVAAYQRQPPSSAKGVLCELACSGRLMREGVLKDAIFARRGGAVDVDTMRALGCLPSPWPHTQHKRGACKLTSWLGYRDFTPSLLCALPVSSAFPGLHDLPCSTVDSGVRYHCRAPAFLLFSRILFC
jgi:hypothetical protein